MQTETEFFLPKMLNKIQHTTTNLREKKRKGNMKPNIFHRKAIKKFLKEVSGNADSIKITLTSDECFAEIHIPFIDKTVVVAEGDLICNGNPISDTIPRIYELKVIEKREIEEFLETEKKSCSQRFSWLEIQSLYLKLAHWRWLERRNHH